MKYIRFNRVIFEREREKNVNFQESFRRKGKNYRSSTFSKIRLEISLLKSNNFSLSLTHSLIDSGSKGVRRNATYHAEFLFIRKGDSFSKHNVSFPINSRGLPPSILAIVTDTGYGNLPLPVKHYSCFNVRCGEVSQSKRSESACVHFC